MLVVAVLDSETVFEAASNTTYRKHFKLHNPNSPLLHAHEQSGSQVMTEIPLKEAIWVLTSLSALSDFVVHDQRSRSFR